MARHLSEEEISVFRDLFHQYDIDKGGNISVDEFSKVMKQTDKNITNAEVAKIIGEVDEDGDGTINFDEFLMMMTGRTRAPPAEKETQQPLSPEIDPDSDYKVAFQTFSPSLNGSITASQFRQAMADLGENVTDAEVEEVMNNVDGDEKISCKENLSLFPESPSVPTFSVESNSKFPLLQFWKRKEMNADHVAVGRLQTGSLSILRRAIAFGELQKPIHEQLIKDSVSFAKENLNKYEDVTQAELAVDTMMVKLSLKIVPYLTGYVHTQTNPLYSYSKSKTIANAERIVSIYKALDPSFDASRVCIKIPSTWEGIEACRVLEKKGISTLATTLFCIEQAVLAADAGCTYIAPYVNELKVHFVPDYVDKNKAFTLCHIAQSYYTLKNAKTQVLPASLTSIYEVMNLAGVHHITISPHLLKQLAETAGTGRKALFPSPDSPLDSKSVAALEESLSDESKWRMAYTLSDEGANEVKLGQAINIFVKMQRGLEEIAEKVAKLG